MYSARVFCIRPSFFSILQSFFVFGQAFLDSARFVCIRPNFSVFGQPFLYFGQMCLYSAWFFIFGQAFLHSARLFLIRAIFSIFAQAFLYSARPFCILPKCSFIQILARSLARYSIRSLVRSFVCCQRQQAYMEQQLAAGHLPQGQKRGKNIANRGEFDVFGDLFCQGCISIGQSFG